MAKFSSTSTKRKGPSPALTKAKEEIKRLKSRASALRKKYGIKNSSIVAIVGGGVAAYVIDHYLTPFLEEYFPEYARYIVPGGVALLGGYLAFKGATQETKALGYGLLAGGAVQLVVQVAGEWLGDSASPRVAEQQAPRAGGFPVPGYHPRPRAVLSAGSMPVPGNARPKTQAPSYTSGGLGMPTFGIGF